MNENSTKAIIDAIAEKFGIVIDWAAQDAIPYLEELMRRIVSFEIGLYTFWMIFCPLMAVAFGISAYNLFKKAETINKYDWDGTFPGIMGIITTGLAGCFAIATCIMIPVGVIRIIECINIPEKIFLEYIGGCFGGGK